MSIRTKLSALLVLCVLTPLLFSAVFWTRQLDPRDDRGRTSFAGREERRQSVSVPPEAPSRYLFFLKSRDEMFDAISERMSRSMERRNAAVAKALARAGRDLDVGLRVLARQLAAAGCFTERRVSSQCGQIVDDFQDTHPDIAGIWVPGSAIERRSRTSSVERAAAVRAALGSFLAERRRAVFHPMVVEGPATESESASDDESARRSAQRVLVSATIEGGRSVVVWSALADVLEPYEGTLGTGRSQVSGLIDRAGRLLVPMHLPTEEGERQLTNFPESFDGGPESAAARAAADNLRHGRAATGRATVSGQKVLFAYRPIDGSDLGVVSLANPALSSGYLVHDALWTYLVIVLLAVVVAVGAAVLVAHGVTGRLRDLTEATEQIGTTTTLDVELSARGRDEVARLARSVRSMAEQIATHVRTLEAKVDERTRELRLKAEELERANADLVRLTKMKSDFLAQMSHELRTPLNSIIGFSELVLSGGVGTVTPPQRDFLERINRNGKSLLQLINDILDVAKIEADRLTLKLAPLSVKLVVDAAVGNLALRAAQKGVPLTTDVDPRIPEVTSDEVRLLQILNNLVSNAVKFTDQGSVTVTARLIHPRRLSLTVRDTGIGMDAKDVANLFTEFFQTAEARARKQEGTGLGLVITKRLVEALGGTIAVQSERGVGTTFTVELPIVTADANTETTTEATPATAAEQGRTRTILCVDDSADAHLLLREYFKGTSVRLVEAYDAAQALRLAEEAQPDVILLDIELPEPEQGRQLFSDLRENPKTKEIPIVVVSVVDWESLGKNLVPDGYILKPVTLDLLFSELRRYGITPPPQQCILVIDDKHDYVALLKQGLEAKGLKVLTAYDGKRGLELAREWRPQLVIVDLLMPLVSGFEFLTRLRQDAGMQDQRVVVVTAKDLTPSERAELEAHALAIFDKSTTSTDVLPDKIQELLPAAPSA
jgi:signal transduction histidine kinase/CheY-like chemotaxis protein